MTLTTAQAFDRFMEIISPTPTQRQEITSKRTATEGYLAKALPSSSTLPLKRVILIGSAARGTIVRPLQDIDVLAEFNNKDNIFEQYRRDSGAFLQRISRALDAKTSIASIGARGQAVRLFYQNGAYVDIAPVFAWQGGGFALPKGDGGWITTDPEVQGAWYTQRRAELGSDLTPIVKLARRWNNVHSHHFRSYHLEVVVCHSFSKVGGNWRNDLKILFDYAPLHISVTDPAGHFGLLDDYLTHPARHAIKSRFAEASERAGRAIAAEAQGDHGEAKRLWRIELGDEFPIG
jgi:predicted nucleotidyltransferase